MFVVEIGAVTDAQAQLGEAALSLTCAVDGLRLISEAMTVAAAISCEAAEQSCIACVAGRADDPWARAVPE